ncbi:MAG: hypothetical protein U0234_31310 [Sandaracinus sp.]
MRTFSATILAFLFGLGLATSASAQDRPGATPEPSAAGTHAPTVTVEIQGRIGGGASWVAATDPAGLPGAESGHSGDMNFGATLSLRHASSGLGLTAGYTHAFTGIETRYGNHGLDLRLSERLAFFRRRHVELSVLLEAGFVYLTGGAHYECPSSWFFGQIDSSCVDRDVPVSGMGGIGAVGFQVRVHALLLGLEADYRHVEGQTGIRHQDDLMIMFRTGVAFDL